MEHPIQPISPDEQALIADIEQTLKDIQKLLGKEGFVPSHQIPDKIALLHPAPSFTQAVDAILAREEAQLNVSPAKRPRP